MMKKLQIFGTIVLIIIEFGLLSNCGEDNPRQTINTLYDKLGGTSMVVDPADPQTNIESGRLAIRNLVEDAIVLIAADDRLMPYFQTLIDEVNNENLSGFTALSENFTDYICIGTGADHFDYTGLDMASAHDPEINSRMGHAVTNNTYDYFIENIVTAANTLGLSQEVIQELGELLENGRSDIVISTFYSDLGGDEIVEDPTGGEIEAGRLKIRTIVEDALMINAADERMTPYFESLLAEVSNNDLSNYNLLSENFTDLLSQELGSANFKYTGLSMADAHNTEKNERMAFGADDDTFDAFVQNVATAADMNDLSSQQIEQLGDLMEKTREDITMGSDVSLYAKLGGSISVDDPINSGESIEKGHLHIRNIVDELLLIVASDEVMAPYFETLLLEVGQDDLSGYILLGDNIANFLSSATGSENILYTGLTMKEAHDPIVHSRMGLATSSEAFDQFLVLTVEAAELAGIPNHLIVEIGELLETTRDDIVASSSFYDRLGGDVLIEDPEEAGQMIEQGRLNIRTIVNDAILVIATDDRISGFFEVLLNELDAENTSGFERLSLNFTDYLCVAAGSENFTYTGMSLENAHDPDVNDRISGIIDDAAYDAFSEDIKTAATNNAYPKYLINELTVLVESLRGDIVM